jgi:FSR family fosmidomycin resistance protein-like MFS transporter
MVLGVTAGVAGVLYIALGRLQELIGLTPGLAVGFTLVLPAAAIAFTVLTRHTEAAQ